MGTRVVKAAGQSSRAAFCSVCAGEGAGQRACCIGVSWHLQGFVGICHAATAAPGFPIAAVAAAELVVIVKADLADWQHQQVYRILLGGIPEGASAVHAGVVPLDAVASRAGMLEALLLAASLSNLLAPTAACTACVHQNRPTGLAAAADAAAAAAAAAAANIDDGVTCFEAALRHLGAPPGGGHPAEGKEERDEEERGGGCSHLPAAPAAPAAAALAACAGAVAAGPGGAARGQWQRSRRPATPCGAHTCGRACTHCVILVQGPCSSSLDRSNSTIALKARGTADQAAALKQEHAL
eukprot:1159183-Pelagomonas_calceolata.AAC.9